MVETRSAKWVALYDVYTFLSLRGVVHWLFMHICTCTKNTRTYILSIAASVSEHCLVHGGIVFMIPKHNTSKFFYYECFYGVTLHQERMMMLLVVMHSWLHTMLCLNTTAIDSACVCVYKATMMIIYHISFDFIAQSYYGNNDYIIRISLHVQTHHTWLVLPDMILVWLVALIRILAGRDL